MNKKIGLILFSFAMMLVVPLTALGIGFPHNTANKVRCTDCHNANTSLSANDFNNVCTNCHKPNSANIYVKSLFYQADAANIYNRFNGYSGGITPLGGTMFTSHNWAGSEVVDQAGAASPSDPMLNSDTLGKTLSCARCHSVHGSRSSTVNSAPFLRSLNGNDEMCLSCHLKRNVGQNTTDKLGSHPVNFRYTSATSKAVTSPTDYFVPPRNANQDSSTNKTSGMKLVNGKVLCTTCHATHYADSRSNHVVDRNSWQALSSSRGMLLRTDTFGKTDEDSSINICTNCHNRPNHQVYPESKTKTSPIQCVDCHSGHVEYLKPEDVALKNINPQNAIPNVYLLRRYMNYSNGVKLDSYRRKAFLTSTSSTAPLSNRDGNAICQACHSLPSNVPEHFTTTDKNQCMLCHEGGSHTRSAPCKGCHGYPPQNTGGLRGPAGDGETNYKGLSIYKNESTAGHPTHSAGKPYSFACEQCHKNNISLDKHNKHASNSFQDVFGEGNKVGIIAGGGATFAPGVTSSTCSDMYCHSYGTRTSLRGAKTVTWVGLTEMAGSSRGSIVATNVECIACHNGVGVVNGASYNNLSTNSHFRHVDGTGVNGKQIGCVVCHSATVSSNTTISNTANHVNGVPDLAFSGSFISSNLIDSTWNSSTTACNTYCHSAGTYSSRVAPKWNDRSTGSCNTCHDTALSSTIIASNGHLTHFSSASINDDNAIYGPRLVGNGSCTYCHSTSSSSPFSELGSKHVDGHLDANYSDATCTIQCHRNNPAPIWTIRSDNTIPAADKRLRCETCHDGNISYDTRTGFNSISAPRKGMDNFSTNGHRKYNMTYYCTTCHDNQSKHISGIRGDNTRLSDYSTSKNGQNGLCRHCHNDTAVVTQPARNQMLTHRLTTEYQPEDQASASATMLCSACHDVHGTSNNASINAEIQFGTFPAAPISYPVSGSNFVSAADGSQRGLCQVCHTLTNHFRRDMSESDAGDGWKGSGTSHKGFGPSTQCLDCHKHNVGKFAFSPEGGVCDACHGYPPVRPIGNNGQYQNYSIGNMGHYNNYSTAKFQDYSGGGGFHAVAGHLPATVKASDGWLHCNKCHYNTNHSMDTTKFRGNSTVTKKSRVNVIVDPQYKFNATETLDESKYIKLTPGNSGKCSNVSCHFQHTPRWGEDK